LTLDHGWVVAAERCGQAMISEPGVRYRAIVTCGPPHLVHLAGLHLLRQFGIPFVMDLRDPWRFVERLPESIASPVWLRCAQMLEDRCVREASLVISNTEAASELLKRTYPAHGPFIWVRNGSDEIRPAPPRTDRQFLVAFAGSIYLDRDPRPLFEASARVIRERQLEPDGFRLVLVGNTSEFDGRPVSALAEEAGIGEYVDILSSVSRDELVHILERASILVSLPQDSDLAIPSKIYEYAEYPAWLLAISDATSATGALLEGSEADLVPPGSTDAIHRALDRRYGQFARGETPSSLAEDSRFRRSAQADRLVEALESITPGAE
jgi:hypothetical protein